MLLRECLLVYDSNVFQPGSHGNLCSLVLLEELVLLYNRHREQINVCVCVCCEGLPVVCHNEVSL